MCVYVCVCNETHIEQLMSLLSFQTGRVTIAYFELKTIQGPGFYYFQNSILKSSWTEETRCWVMLSGNERGTAEPPIARTEA